MNPLIYVGNICIGLAVALSILGIIFFFISRKLHLNDLAGWGRATVYANFILMTVANFTMTHALITDQFGISYVAQVGSIETPRWISAISLWSSLEGSILFWGWILSAYGAVCIYMYREKEENLLKGVGLTLLAVQLFFYILLALPANPFQAVIPAPANGPGPNPLLQNHWLMAVHPPFLYIGYIGMVIPFAFAIAALIETDLPGQWVAWTRRWTLFAWSFLSMAIILGGWWSYAVLGWGGYWAWDPVENASFMPWLAATALIHSVIVQEKRKLFPVWNLILAILTFLLTLLGTFLTRSGVLDSVHSFTESHVGPYFLVFMGIVLTASLILLLWQGPKFRKEGGIENLFSLEVLFLFNNLLFLGFCLMVFLGTLYPLIIEALQDKRLSVGEPYFNQMTVPLTGMILLLMGIGILVPWKRPSRNFQKLLRWPALISVLFTTAVALLGVHHPAVIAMILFSTFAFLAMAFEVARLPEKHKLLVQNPRRYGGFISHTGLLLIAVAVAFSSVYETDKEVTLKRGESVDLDDYSLSLSRLEANEAPQRFEVRALVEVSKKGKFLDTLTPQMNFYPVSAQPIGSPAIRSTLIGDLYLTLIHFEKDGSEASLRILTAPAVAWIWIGGLIVMLGGLVPVVFKSSGES